MKIQLMVLMEALDHQIKKLVLILVKQTQFWFYIIILIIVICLLIEKETFQLKADNKNVNSPTHFYLGHVTNEFSATESREVSLNWNVFDFAVDYNSIDKYDILNLHKYLMTKNNIK